MSFFRDHYNIGVWFWELPTFPDAWHDRFAEYDEIWAQSAFIADALATRFADPDRATCHRC